MPELPEVETVVRDLRPLLIGTTVTSIQIGDKPLRREWVAAWEPLIVGRLITAIDRRGKWIRIRLDDGSFLIVHLGMTGQLTVQPANADLESHSHFRFNLDPPPAQLRFRDIRRFGSIFRIDNDADWQTFLAGTLGPEPWDLEPLPWREALHKTDRTLKAILLDQRVVAGVGNIYADESLYAARLHPRRVGSSLSPREAERLRMAIVQVLTTAIADRGTTLRDYVGGSGLRGSHQEALCVYGREGLPCVRCRSLIVQIRLAGRSTHYCGKCQPEPK